MIVFTRRVSLCLAAVLGFGCAAVVLAQGGNGVPDSTGSLAALTAEVQKLRVAVEQSTRSQTQTQALAVYLSVQQNRILQVATRLDTVRKELDAAAVRSREIASHLANAEEELLRTTEPSRRIALQEATQGLKAEQQRVGLQEQQARVRETELSQALQLEESRWSELISRLEQVINK
jgi:hypothetical protein